MTDLLRPDLPELKERVTYSICLNPFQVVHKWSPCHREAVKRSHVDRTIVLLKIGERYVPVVDSAIEYAVASSGAEAAAETSHQEPAVDETAQDEDAPSLDPLTSQQLEGAAPASSSPPAGRPAEPTAAEAADPLTPELRTALESMTSQEDEEPRNDML